MREKFVNPFANAINYLENLFLAYFLSPTKKTMFTLTPQPYSHQQQQQQQQH